MSRFSKYTESDRSDVFGEQREQTKTKTRNRWNQYLYKNGYEYTNNSDIKKAIELAKTRSKEAGAPTIEGGLENASEAYTRTKAQADYLNAYGKVNAVTKPKYVNLMNDGSANSASTQKYVNPAVNAAANLAMNAGAKFQRNANARANGENPSSMLTTTQANEKATGELEGLKSKYNFTDDELKFIDEYRNAPSKVREIGQTKFKQIMQSNGISDEEAEKMLFYSNWEADANQTNARNKRIKEGLSDGNIAKTAAYKGYYALTSLMGEVAAFTERVNKATHPYADESFPLNTNSEAWGMKNINDTATEIESENAQDFARNFVTEKGGSEKQAEAAATVARVVDGAINVTLENLIPARTIGTLVGNTAKAAGWTQKAANTLTKELITSQFFFAGYNNGKKEAIERGLSEEESDQLGIAFGLGEYIFEHLGADEVVDIINGATKTPIKTVIMGILKDTGGEVATDIWDDVTQLGITGENSWTDSLAYYQSEQYTQDTGNKPLTQEEAIKQTIIDTLLKYGETAAISFISAGGGLVSQQAITSGIETRGGKAMGRTEGFYDSLSDKNSPYYISDDINDYRNAEAYQNAQEAKTQAYVDEGKKLNGKEARSLYRNISDAINEQTAAKAQGAVNEITQATDAKEFVQAEEKYSNIESDAVKEAIKTQKAKFDKANLDAVVTEKKALEIGKSGKELTQAQEEYVNQQSKEEQATLKSALQQGKNQSAIENDNHTAIDETTGKTVSIDYSKGIAKEGDNFVLTDTDGNTHNTSDINTNTTMRTAIRLASTMENEAEANGVLEAFAGNTNAEPRAILRGINQVTSYGQIGTSFDSFVSAHKDALLAGGLNIESFRTLYNAISKQAVESDSGKANPDTVKNGTGKVHNKTDVKLSKQAERFFNKFGKKFNVDFEFFYEESKFGGTKGEYLPEEGKIRINLAKGKDVFEIAFHEGIGEFLQAHNAEAYNEIATAILDYLQTTNSEELEQTISTYKAAYIASGSVNKTTRAAANEFVNNQFAKIFATDEGIRDFSEWLFKNDKKSVAEKIADFFADMQAIIKECIAQGGLTTNEKLALEKDAKEAARIRKMILDAADTAIGNKTDEKLIEAFNTQNEKEINSYMGGELFSSKDSRRTSLEIDDKLMNAAFKYNSDKDKGGRVNPLTLAQAQSARKIAKDILVKYKKFLPADIMGQVLEKNGSYGRTVENSLICVRSLVSNYYMDLVSEKMGRPLTVNEQLLASQVLANITGDQRECSYCYVATDRRTYRAFFNNFYDMYSAVYDDVQNNLEEYQNDKWYGYEKFRNGRKDTDNLRKQYEHFVKDGLAGNKSLELSDLTTAGKRAKFTGRSNHDWLVREAERYCKAAAWPKNTNRKVKINGQMHKLEYVAYNGSILKMSPELVEKLNEEFGLRMYSYSDYVPAFLLENMQEVTDAAVRGLKMLAYTKDVGFAKVFAPSGMGINISIFGGIENGQVYEDGMMGASWEEAKQLRKDYPNVGTVFVATNDELVEWALAQDWIDVVIPYHLVRTGTEVAEHYGYTNYKAMQEDKKASNWSDGNLKSIPPTVHKNDLKTYKQALKDNNLTARFGKWIDNPNYMKLVNETRMSYADMSPVQPLFDMDAVRSELARIPNEGTYGLLQGVENEEQQDAILEDSVNDAVAKIKDTSRKSIETDDYAPTFYSKMEREIDSIKSDKIGANSVINYLKGKGVKADEIKWSGIETFLEGKKSVTKQELKEFVAANNLQIEEKTLSRNAGKLYDDFAKEALSYYQFDGDDLEYFFDYDQTFIYDLYKTRVDELLEDGEIDKKQHEGLLKAGKSFADNDGEDTRWGQFSTEGTTNYREILFKMPNSDYTNDAMKAHWRESGVLAHARIDDIELPSGDKMLFVEEIQSDWHNAGAKNGYQTEQNKPTAPELSEEDIIELMRRDDAITKLINRYKQVTNDESAYDYVPHLIKREGMSLANSSMYQRNGIRTDFLMMGFELNEDETEVVDKYTDMYKSLYENPNYERSNEVKRKPAPDAPFKTTYTDFVMKRLLREAAEGGYDYIGWTTGKMQEDRWSSDFAEGYRIEYDQDIPKFMNKYGKQWGAKVEDVNTGNNEVHAVKITPEMKQSVLYEGQARFSIEVNTRGQKLTTEQKEFFKDSKAVDENGNLRVLYHGTYANFSIFDPVQFGGVNGIQEGYGIYLTDDDFVAQTYGNAMELYANITKPASSKEKTISKNDLVKLIKATCEYDADKLFYDGGYDDVEQAIKDTWISNYTDTYGVGIESAYRAVAESILGSNKNDKDIIQEVMFGMSVRDYDSAYEFYYILTKTLGFDGFHTEWTSEQTGATANIYVAFNSEQVKSIDNKKPTSDPDIRKSIEVLGEASPYKSTYEQMEVVTQIMQTMNNNLRGVDWYNSLKYAFEEITYRYKLKNDENIQLINDIGNAFKYMFESDDVSYPVMMDYLMQIADEVLADSNLKNPEQERIYTETKKAISSYKIKLTDAERKELKNRYGGKWTEAFGALNKAGIKLDNNGQSMDDGIFKQMANDILHIGGIKIDETTTPVDQLIAVMDAMDALSKIDSEFEAFNDKEMQLAVVTDLLESFYRGAAQDLKTDIAKGTEAGKKQIQAAIKSERKRLSKANSVWKKERQALFNAKEQELEERIKELNKERAAWQKEARLTEAQMKATAKAEARKVLDSHAAAQEKAKQINKIKSNANRLMKMMQGTTDKTHMPDFLKPAVSQFLSGIDFLANDYNPEAKGNANWLAKMQGLYTVMDKLRRIENGDIPVTDKDTYEMMMLAGRIDASMITNMIDNFNRSVRVWNESTQDYVPRMLKVSNLSTEQLTQLSDLMSALTTSITNINNTLANEMHEKNAEMGRASAEELGKLKKRKMHNKAMNKLIDFMTLDEAEPITFFEGLGKTAKSVFDELRQGFNQKTKRVREASKYMIDTKKRLGLTDKETSKWKKQSYTFNLEEGKVTLTIPQIMSLYETVKRDQGKLHVMLGGIVAGDAEVKDGKFTKVNHQARPVHITYDEYQEIVSKLNDKQIAIADAMQQYMAKECSKWGNNVTLKLYGFTKFAEDNYFPVSTHKYSRGASDRTENNNVSLYAIKNSSFTKSLVPNANNAAVINDIFDVYTDHVVNMAEYEGYTLPLMDALQWFNYDEKYVNANEFGARADHMNNIQTLIDEVFGVKANAYFINFLKNINGEFAGKGGDVEILNTLTSRFKAQAVMSNLRVVIQQYGAIIRSAAEINPKYIIASILDKPISYAKKAQDNSQIAWWKSQGYYETMLGKSISELITGNHTMVDTINDWAGKPAGFMDDLAWGTIYRAAERKVMSETNLKYDSEEFTAAVVKEFENIIDHTQVVDTIFHKSQIMRSKNFAAKAATAFMAEPTKQLNVIYRAARQLYYSETKAEKNKAATMLSNTLLIFAIEQILNAAKTAVMDAFRDDDKDDWEEAYKEKFKENFFDNINLLTKIPVIKELFSAMDGYSASRTEFEGMYTAVSTVQEIAKALNGESKKTTYGMLQLVAKTVSQLGGIPIYSALREVKTAHNSAIDILGLDVKKWYTTEDAAKKAAKKKAKREADKIYDTNDLSSIKKHMAQTYDDAMANTADATPSDGWSAVRAELKDEFIRQYNSTPDSDKVSVVNRYKGLLKETKSKDNGKDSYSKLSDKDIENYINKWKEYAAKELEEE